MEAFSWRVLPRIPEDSRLIADRHTNTVFPITRFSSREEVDRRLRMEALSSAGLESMTLVSAALQNGHFMVWTPPHFCSSANLSSKHLFAPG